MPRYHSLLAYPGYMAALERGQLRDGACRLSPDLSGRCLSALLQGWVWALWPAQLQAMEDWQQQVVSQPATSAQDQRPNSIMTTASSSSSSSSSSSGQHPLTILWPLLPGRWSGINLAYSSPGMAAVSAAASTSHKRAQGLLPLKPSLQQLQVALEGCMLEHQGQRMGCTLQGLLLLAIMLSVADPLARMTFLAGVSGEVLLRLLAEVAAGEEGPRNRKARHLTYMGSCSSRHHWQARLRCCGLSLLCCKAARR
jgi:hypothetical protein